MKDPNKDIDTERMEIHTAISERRQRVGFPVLVTVGVLVFLLAIGIIAYIISTTPINSQQTPQSK